jgi:hypothetical protein
MLRLTSVLACVILASCAKTQEAAPIRDPAAEKMLTETFAQRDKVRAQWESAKAEDRLYCETRAGDCKLQVSDQRDELISSHSTPTCRTQPDSDHEAACIVDELRKQGTALAASEFVKSDLWCLERLNQCVASHQIEQAEAARVARIAQRRNNLEVSPHGMVWRSRVAAASEKIKYIRATLPPDADGECQQVADDPNCDTSINKYNAELDAEFAKADGQYDEKKSGKLYEQLTKVEASCYEPELKCLSKSVAKYGETSESRRWLQRNFDMLDKRQRLIEKAGDGAAAPCLSNAVASHSAEIVQSYRAYVREPVLFFRTQLHRSFFAMHKDQIDCLGGATSATEANG